MAARSRDDNGPGCIYILHSSGMTRTRGEGKQAFKFGYSANVPRRLWNVNSRARITPRGRAEGAYGDYRDWVIVAVWDVQKMRDSEIDLRGFLNSRGQTFSAASATELFRADFAELEAAIDRVSRTCSSRPQRFEWFVDGENTEDALYELRDSANGDYDYELEIEENDLEETEFDEHAELRALDELLEDLDALAEFFATAEEDGWPHPDDDRTLI